MNKKDLIKRSQVCLVPDLEVETIKIQITMKKEQNLQVPQKQALNIPVVRHMVCMNLKRTCSSLDAGKCKMTKAKCVFQQTCA